jgi:superfamily I DNA and/or RNA helicase
MEIKNKQEKLILGQIPIIVTTCKAIQGKFLREIRFKKVIVDEATQAQEIETLIAMEEAD